MALIVYLMIWYSIQGLIWSTICTKITIIHPGYKHCTIYDYVIGSVLNYVFWPYSMYITYKEFEKEKKWFGKSWEFDDEEEIYL